MKKNEFYEGMVTSLKFPNKGIVYVEDEDAYVQVKNTLPGQRVRFQLKKVKKKRPEGNLTEVLVPSEIESSAAVSAFFGMWRLCIPDASVRRAEEVETESGKSFVGCCVSGFSTG